MKATLLSSSIWKLGQLRRSNGRNSQVFGQAMKKRPTGHYKKYSHFKGRDTAATTSSREGNCIVDSSTSGERTLLCSSNTGPAGSGTRRTRAILSPDRTEDDEIFCTALPIHSCVQSTLSLHLMVRPTCLTNSLYLARRRVEKVAPSNRTRHVENATSLSIW